MKSKFKKFKDWLNPDYIGTGVILVIILCMLLQVSPKNAQCNHYLVHRHDVVTREIHQENEHIYKLRAQNLVYHYASVTNRLQHEQKHVRQLKAKYQRQKMENKKHHRKLTSDKINRRRIKSAKFRARLQILNGRHNLYLLDHPELKHHFQYQKLDDDLTNRLTRKHFSNLKTIKATHHLLKKQKLELKTDVPHKPTTNAVTPAYSTKQFNDLTGYVSSILILLIISGFFLVAGFDYKRRRNKSREKAHLEHLYGK